MNLQLLISLPLTPEAQEIFGSQAKTYNKPQDVGIDLPFLEDVFLDNPFQTTLIKYSFDTLFAMFELDWRCSHGAQPSVQEYLEASGYKQEFLDSSFLNKLELLVRFESFPVPYLIHPRSSISNTPFRLSNSTGIIDPSYKGLSEIIEDSDLLGARFDYHPHLRDSDDVSLKKGQRLVQITAKAYEPILWVRLDNTEEAHFFWKANIEDNARGGFGTTNEASK
jgi:dUTPase